MSLCIDVDRVTAVLLADGWHAVYAKSFDIDAYEFDHGGTNLGPGGAGATWTERRGNRPVTCVSCPLTAVLAVRHTS